MEPFICGPDEGEREFPRIKSTKVTVLRNTATDYNQRFNTSTASAINKSEQGIRTSPQMMSVRVNPLHRHTDSLGTSYKMYGIDPSDGHASQRTKSSPSSPDRFADRSKPFITGPEEGYVPDKKSASAAIKPTPRLTNNNQRFKTYTTSPRNKSEVTVKRNTGTYNDQRFNTYTDSPRNKSEATVQRTKGTYNDQRFNTGTERPRNKSEVTVKRNTGTYNDKRFNTYTTSPRNESEVSDQRITGTYNDQRFETGTDSPRNKSEVTVKRNTGTYNDQRFNTYTDSPRNKRVQGLRTSSQKVSVRVDPLQRRSDSLGTRYKMYDIEPSYLSSSSPWNDGMANSPESLAERYEPFITRQNEGHGTDLMELDVGQNAPENYSLNRSAKSPSQYLTELAPGHIPRSDYGGEFSGMKSSIGLTVENSTGLENNLVLRNRTTARASETKKGRLESGTQTIKHQQFLDDHFEYQAEKSLLDKLPRGTKRSTQSRSMESKRELLSPHNEPVAKKSNRVINDKKTVSIRSNSSDNVHKTSRIPTPDKTSNISSGLQRNNITESHPQSLHSTADGKKSSRIMKDKKTVLTNVADKAHTPKRKPDSDTGSDTSSNLPINNITESSSTSGTARLQKNNITESSSTSGTARLPRNNITESSSTSGTTRLPRNNITESSSTSGTARLPRNNITESSSTSGTTRLPRNNIKESSSTSGTARLPRNKITESSSTSGTARLPRNNITESSSTSGTASIQRNNITESSSTSGTARLPRNKITESSSTSGTARLPRNNITESSSTSGTASLQRNKITESSSTSEIASLSRNNITESSSTSGTASLPRNNIPVWSSTSETASLPRNKITESSSTSESASLPRNKITESSSTSGTASLPRNNITESSSTSSKYGTDSKEDSPPSPRNYRDKESSKILTVEKMDARRAGNWHWKRNFNVFTSKVSGEKSGCRAQCSGNETEPGRARGSMMNQLGLARGAKQSGGPGGPATSSSGGRQYDWHDSGPWFDGLGTYFVRYRPLLVGGGEETDEASKVPQEPELKTGGVGTDDPAKVPQKEAPVPKDKTGGAGTDDPSKVPQQETPVPKDKTSGATGSTVGKKPPRCKSSCNKPCSKKKHAVVVNSSKTTLSFEDLRDNSDTSVFASDTGSASDNVLTRKSKVRFYESDVSRASELSADDAERPLCACYYTTKPQKGGKPYSCHCLHPKTCVPECETPKQNETQRSILKVASLTDVPKHSTSDSELIANVSSHSVNDMNESRQISKEALRKTDSQVSLSRSDTDLGQTRKNESKQSVGKRYVDQGTQRGRLVVTDVKDLLRKVSNPTVMVTAASSGQRTCKCTTTGDQVCRCFPTDGTAGPSGKKNKKSSKKVPSETASSEQELANKSLNDLSCDEKQTDDDCDCGDPLKGKAICGALDKVRRGVRDTLSNTSSKIKESLPGGNNTLGTSLSNISAKVKESLTRSKSSDDKESSTSGDKTPGNSPSNISSKIKELVTCGKPPSKRSLVDWIPSQGKKIKSRLKKLFSRRTRTADCDCGDGETIEDPGKPSTSAARPADTAQVDTSSATGDSKTPEKATTSGDKAEKAKPTITTDEKTNKKATKKNKKEDKQKKEEAKINKKDDKLKNKEAKKNKKEDKENNKEAQINKKDDKQKNKAAKKNKKKKEK